MPILVSYAYARKGNGKAIFEQLVDDPTIDVMLDCGAHTLSKQTGKVDIGVDDYCDFASDYKDNLWGWVSFDKIGDPEQSFRNYQRILDKGLRPWPVHTLGEGQERMDFYFQHSDTVALGGLLRPRDTPITRAQQYAYIKQKMIWARGRKVHWFGFTRKELLPTYTPYSCDSCTWANGTIYGQLAIYMGNGKWITSYGYKDRRKVRRDSQAMQRIRKVCPSFDIDKDEHWRGPSNYVFQLTCDSWVRYSIDVYRTFGTRVVLATSPASQHVGHITSSIREHQWRFGK